MILPTLNIFLITILSLITLSVIGDLFLNKYLNLKTRSIIILPVGGIIVCIISLALNFFFPINEIVSILLILLSLIYFIKNQKKNLINYKQLIFGGLLSVLFFLYGNNHEDYPAYHLPYIQAVNEFKIIFGMINHKLNFGQSSILFYGDAVFQNKLLINYPISLISFIFFLSILFLIIEKKSEKKFFFSEYFLLVSVSFIFLKFSRLGSHGTDFSSFLIVLLGIYFFIKIDFNNIEKKINIYYSSLALIFLTSAYFFKIFSIFYFLLSFVIFYFIFKKKIFYIYNKIFILIFLFNIVFLIKNFIITGCLLYPVTLTCYEGFDWNLKKISISNWQLTNEAWAKGWPDQNLYKSYEKFSENFNWINTWLKNHFLKSLEKVFIPILLIIFFIKKIINKKKNYHNINIVFVFATCFVSSIVWFVYAPLTRLGLVSIIPLLIILSNKKFLYDFSFTIKKKYFDFLIIFLVIFFSIKNLNRISSHNVSNYENNPYPRINKNNYDINNKKNFETKYENQVKYYTTKDRYCYLIKYPCIPDGENKNFLFYKQFNYIFLKKLND